MAANAPFTSVTGKVVSNYSPDGMKMVVGSAVGPDVAGAATVIDLSDFFNGKIYKLTIEPSVGTTYYLCQATIPATGATTSPVVNIFAGNDPAQSTADLSAVTFSWTAVGTDYE
jgi:hypothetical protein